MIYMEQIANCTRIIFLCKPSTINTIKPVKPRGLKGSVTWLLFERERESIGNVLLGRKTILLRWDL